MDLQMQLKRALIAFAVWAALGGIALSRAGAPSPHAATPGEPAPVLVRAHDDARCRVQLRVELTPSLRLTLPCDRHCAPVRAIAQALSMPVSTRLDACEMVRRA